MLAQIELPHRTGPADTYKKEAVYSQNYQDGLRRTASRRYDGCKIYHGSCRMQNFPMDSAAIATTYVGSTADCPTDLTHTQAHTQWLDQPTSRKLFRSSEED